MGSRTSARVWIRHRLRSLNIRVEFEIRADWTVLFGPSGSGKSTILRAMAGLIRPDSGRIELAGNVVFDSEENIWVSAHQRLMRWSPQRSMINPHKSVGWNLRFGATLGTLSKSELGEATAHFGFGDPEARADRLSGGERQRLVAVRAALTARRRLLLLDEPFTGMDALARGRLIDDLRGWLGPTPVISVTHDVGEAFLLGEDVIRIADGEVAAQGPAAQVLKAERVRLQGWLG